MSKKLDTENDLVSGIETSEKSELEKRQKILNRISHLITWSERHKCLNNSLHVFYNVKEEIIEESPDHVVRYRNYLVIFDRSTNQEIVLNSETVEELKSFILEWF